MNKLVTVLVIVVIITVVAVGFVMVVDQLGESHKPAVPQAYPDGHVRVSTAGWKPQDIKRIELHVPSCFISITDITNIEELLEGLHEAESPFPPEDPQGLQIAPPKVLYGVFVIPKVGTPTEKLLIGDYGFGNKFNQAFNKIITKELDAKEMKYFFQLPHKRQSALRIYPNGHIRKLVAGWKPDDIKSIELAGTGIIAVTDTPGIKDLLEGLQVAESPAPPGNLSIGKGPLIWVIPKVGKPTDFYMWGESGFGSKFNRAFNRVITRELGAREAKPYLLPIK